MSRICLLFAALGVICASAWADEGHHHDLSAEEIGAVHFATSCARNQEAAFNLAVALLHSFQYEQARAGFQAIAKSDPKCAMAQWGIAMSHYHGLWNNGDMKAGAEAIQAATAIRASNSKTTAREVDYINALAEVYRDDGKDKTAHAQAFEQKMGALQAAYPSDNEAAIFHALALAITAPKTDKTFSNQRKCGEILEPIFKQQPHHPGVAHYLIHCYDNPVLAEQGLDAARAYAKIAPASAHANHMPSHIFTRVGSWDESIDSNIKSAELAAAAEASSKNGEARDQRLHAMDYLEYAYLQSGRIREARAVLDDMNSLPPVAGLTLTGNYATAAIPARYSLELGKWAEASRLAPPGDAVPWAQAISWTAIGVGSARAGQPDRAGEAEHNLARLRDSTAAQNNKYWSDQVEVQRREVAAWITRQQGDSEGALAAMKSAAELEESMDKDAVTPGAVVPAREMLAQMQMLDDHTEEALDSYEAVLSVAPNRFNAVYGAAMAADASGNSAVANRYFKQLTRISADDQRPELATARQHLAVTAKASSGQQ
jgi:Tfp pilus assembly protein PilF